MSDKNSNQYSFFFLVIAATVMFMTPDRIPFVEYLTVPTPTHAKFVFRSPPLTYVSNIFYLPFTAMVWACTLVLVILSVVIIYLTYTLPKYPEGDHPQESLVFSDVVLFTLGVICQLASPITPKSYSGKISVVCKIEAFDI